MFIVGFWTSEATHLNNHLNLLRKKKQQKEKKQHKTSEEDNKGSARATGAYTLFATLPYDMQNTLKISMLLGIKRCRQKSRVNA